MPTPTTPAVTGSPLVHTADRHRPRARQLAAAAAALGACAMLLAPVAVADAQSRDSASAAMADTLREPRPDTVKVRRDALLPRAAAREAARRYNGEQAIRANGSLTVAADRVVEGGVAVLNGPLVVAGHITGDVVAVNADVTLEAAARIDGDLFIAGGTVRGPAAVERAVGGRVRVYRQAMQYREEGEEIFVERTFTVFGEREAEDDEPAEADDRRWWRGWLNGRERGGSNLLLATGGTYNRVEGLPIHAGPTFRYERPYGRVTGEALGVWRSADGFRWDSDNLGHRANLELRAGDRRALAIGGRLFDVVDGVEDWQMPDDEVGLAAFFLHRDYRDYFNRHGAGLYAAAHAGEGASLTLGLSDERWGSRVDRDPYSLTRNSQSWRPNPRMDEGRFHLATATLRLDTRNDESNPWSGWYLTADIERGDGELTSVAPRGGIGLPIALLPLPARERTAYTRGFLDMRRYNRIAPNAQLNVRAVLGGHLGGDQLPLQRRFSLGGPGSMPGYDFRRAPDGSDVLTCSPSGPVASGRPALCDRVALAQVEYRGDLRVRTFGVGDDDERDDGGVDGDAPRTRRSHRFRYSLSTRGQWVVFADAGRGWLVRDRGVTPTSPPDDELLYESSRLPAFSSFRTDLGGGFDFGGFGVYVAKSLSDSSMPPNFFVRVRRRF